MCSFTHILESLKGCYILILEEYTHFSKLSLLHLHVPLPLTQHPWDLVLYIVSQFQLVYVS